MFTVNNNQQHSSLHYTPDSPLPDSPDSPVPDSPDSPESSIILIETPQRLPLQESEAGSSRPLFIEHKKFEKISIVGDRY